MKNLHVIGKELFITSDEEIKKDDYYLGDDNHIYCLCTTVNSNGKKIILTTNADYIEEGIQAIDDKFLEWFVNNPSCEEVEVEENKHLICNHCDSLYSSFSDGIHCDVCVRMSKPIVKVLGYKIIIPKEEPKQETLEEAAEKYNDDFQIKGGSKAPHIKNVHIMNHFIEGAKWQQERMYSEEEVLGFGKFCVDKIASFLDGKGDQTDGQEYSMEELFDQFKKK